MRFIAILLLFLASFASASYSAEPYQLVPPRIIRGMNNVRAAVLLPMSGPFAEVGNEMRRSIEFALTGSRNPRVILQFYDSGGTYQTAREAARRARMERADIIIGPLLREETLGVRREGVRAISFTTSADALSSNIVSMGAMPNDQIERIIELAASRGKRRFAIITPRSDTGNVMRNLARAQIRSVGGEIIYDEQFTNERNNISRMTERVSNFDARTRESTEFAARVERRLNYLQDIERDFPAELEFSFDGTNYPSARAEMASLERALEALRVRPSAAPPPFDAIFLFADDMNDLIMLGAMLLYYDVRPDEVRILGLAQLNDERIFAERAFRGAWFPLAPSRHLTQFTEAHQQFLGTAPSGFALQAYDAASLVVSGLASGGGLTGRTGFSGLSGTFRFRPDGRAERLLEIREITGGRTGTRIISPAGAQF